jgi:cation:H+ antiporter
MLIDLIIFILSLAALIASGSLLVRSISKIAKFFHISEYVIGFILLAFATSIPELFENLTIIRGIPILLAKGIKIKSPKTKNDSLYMVILSILPLVLMLVGNQISRFDGILLIIAFFIYIRKLYLERKVFKKEFENRISKGSVIASMAIFIFSLIILFASAEFLVETASSLAIVFALPPILIGLFLVAIGTSLPELVVGTNAALKGHSQISIGNIIGSVIANSTLILGVTALIFPITSNFLLFITSGVYMILTTFSFATFIRSGSRIDWEEGLSLILLYAFFIILEFYIKGAIA